MFALLIIAALMPSAHAQSAYGRRLHSDSSLSGGERHLTAYKRRLQSADESMAAAGNSDGIMERVQRLFDANN